MENNEQGTKIQMARLETGLAYVSQSLDELKKTMQNTTDLLHKIDKSTDAIPMLEKRISRTEDELECIKTKMWRIALAVAVIASGGSLIVDKFL